MFAQACEAAERYEDMTVVVSALATQVRLELTGALNSLQCSLRVLHLVP